MPGTIRWMYSGTGVPTTHIPNDPDGHGTCVASKATGAHFGTAKGPDLVVVKVEHGVRQGTISMLRALALVALDVRANNLVGMAVVNLSSDIGIPVSRQTSDEIGNIRLHEHILR
jgi:hypothetical protein